MVEYSGCSCDVVVASAEALDDDFPLNAKPRRQKGNKAGPGNMATSPMGILGSRYRKICWWSNLLI